MTTPNPSRPFEVPASAPSTAAAAACTPLPTNGKSPVDVICGNMLSTATLSKNPRSLADLPQPGTSSWDRLSHKTKQAAHDLRRAFAGALELYGRSKWGRDEIEAAGRSGYVQSVGHPISSRTFWRLFDTVIERDAGRREFGNLALYLPNVLQRRATPDVFAKLAKSLPTLVNAVHGVEDVNAPTVAQVLLIWDSALNEHQDLIDAGMSPKKATETVVAALNACGLPLARSREALRRNFSRKVDRWVEGGRVPSAIRDQRAERSGDQDGVPLTEEDVKKLTARGLQMGSLALAWREFLREGKLSEAVTQRYISNPKTKSYVPKSVREIVGPKIAMLRDVHRGPRQAKLKGAYITRDWSGVLAGDWYQADDTTLGIYYWEEADDGSWRILRGQFLPMIDCGTRRALGVALHSEASYTAAVIRGLIVATHDTYGLPRAGFYFENGIWRSAKLLHGTQPPSDAVPFEETEVGLREWTKFKHALPGNARAKPIERVIGILQTFMQDQPGYVGRDEKNEKFEAVQLKLTAARAGKLHPNTFLLHRDEWIKRIEGVCEKYNDEPQEGHLDGLTPREAWDQRFDTNSPLVKLGPDVRYLLANHRRPMKVRKNGVCVQLGKDRLWFQSEELGALIGQIVQVYFNPDDPSSVFVLRNPTDVAALVVPAAPVIPAMNATAEQLAAANASVANQNRATRTLYAAIKPYFQQPDSTYFRKNVADPATVEMGQEVAADQTAIAAAQSEDKRKQRELAKLRRKFTAPVVPAVSADRQRAGLSLLEEASQ